ncbi:cytochrome c oxidase subunit 3 [Noviherbaspirillum galbum]|uniref:Heme-copper oxidase subunit III n=1 Tax=Noviherbaspirillum galbum TaxID=2709383 RepID=A0A6B3SJM3_9BURK|nr:cytochrome c oxidase subunit 3 [Noviherbaspirillum galbum]NEX61011.1 heme-copper oxidase subunit III [Noviherbaspirillum galbum]
MDRTSLPPASGRPLPVSGESAQTSGWWGMWCLIVTEAALFAYLLFSYFYLGSQAHGTWVPELPKLKLALPNTILLVASSLVLWWGERGMRSGKTRRLALALGASVLMGAVFVGVQVKEWQDKPFSFTDNAYATSYYTTTGFHMLHVAAGLVMLSVLLLWTVLGKFSAKRHAAVSVGALYWHFVDVVWLAVFFSYYLLPHLG